MVKCEKCGKDSTSYYEKDGRKLCLGCYSDSEDVDKISAKIDEKTNYYKNMGIASIIIGIFAFILLFILGYVFGLLPAGIVSLILGRISKKHGDKNGSYGFFLGLIATILGIIGLIASVIYVWISSMLPA